MTIKLTPLEIHGLWFAFVRQTHKSRRHFGIARKVSYRRTSNSAGEGLW